MITIIPSFFDSITTPPQFKHKIPLKKALEFCHSHKLIPLIKVLFTVFDNEFLIKKIDMSKKYCRKKISNKNQMEVSDRPLISQSPHLALLTKKILDNPASA
jgi:hypothetical protein